MLQETLKRSSSLLASGFDHPQATNKSKFSAQDRHDFTKVVTQMFQFLDYSGVGDPVVEDDVMVQEWGF